VHEENATYGCSSKSQKMIGDYNNGNFGTRKSQTSFDR
jgi:hypothetical protein